MKLTESKWGKWVVGTIGAVIAGGAIMLGGVVVGYPAISGLVGLAVAQSSTLWNNVIDAAKGDSQTSGILGQSTYLWNGVSFDRVKGTSGSMNVALVGAITPADGYANPTTASQVWNLNGIFNGTTWDRQRSASADALAITGMTAVGSMAWNGTSFDRMRTASADALAITGMQASGQMGWNGTANDRVRTASATNNIAATSLGVQQVTQVSTWSVTHTPAVATQATASKAAGGGTVRHVATGITWCVAAGVTPQAVLLIHLRDGATGAGTIIRSWSVSTIASDSKCVDLSGLNMTGTANTAMTLETAAATSATVQGTVTLTGYSTP